MMKIVTPEPDNLSLNVKNDTLQFSRGRFSPANEISEEVLRALRDGDHDAFRMVYLQFVTPLTNFIERLLKQRDVAEDLAQEIMADVWEKRSRINIHTSIKGYLFTIARHAVSNYFRSKRPADVVESTWFLPADAEDSQHLDDQIIARETHMLIQLIVHKMPRQRRTIFEMSNSDGLSNDSIAEKLGISKSSVEKQISYARREIRDAITLFFALFVAFH